MRRLWYMAHHTSHNRLTRNIYFSCFFAEIVTTGSPQTLESWQVLHLNRTYGGFIDAVCDKAFVVPCWIALLNSVPGSFFSKIQYCTLIFLILAEVASGCIRFRAYFSSVGISAPKVEGFDFSTSAVKVRHCAGVDTAIWLPVSLKRSYTKWCIA
jgi:hypothetical protein